MFGYRFDLEVQQGEIMADAAACGKTLEIRTGRGGLSSKAVLRK